ncbi:MAG: SHOCT domain-containing protein [Planctomycetota bacterium]
MIEAGTLVAQAGGQQSVNQAVFWVAILLGAVIAAIFIGLQIRKRLFDPDEQGDDADPVSLQTLRDMHAQGKLSDEEFEKAKGAVLQMAPGSNPLRDEIARRQRERGSSPPAVTKNVPDHAPPPPAPQDPRPAPQPLAEPPRSTDRERFDAKYPTEPPHDPDHA